MKWCSWIKRRPHPGPEGKETHLSLHSHLALLFGRALHCLYKARRMPIAIHLFFTHRMHLALKAYQELLMTMHEMDHSQEETVRDSSNILKSEVFLFKKEYRTAIVALEDNFLDQYFSFTARDCSEPNPDTLCLTSRNWKLCMCGWSGNDSILCKWVPASSWKKMNRQCNPTHVYSKVPLCSIGPTLG